MKVWTDTTVEILVRLWRQYATDCDVTMTKLAEMVMEACPSDNKPIISKSAVIGKIHRLGLAHLGEGRPKAQPIKVKQPKPPKEPRIKIKRAPRQSSFSKTFECLVDSSPLITPSMPDTEFKGVMAMEMLMENKNACKWPIGDPSKSDFRYCGSNCVQSAPYCSYHMRIAYTPEAQRRRASPTHNVA